MKEKDSEQTNYTGDLENNNSKKKIIITSIILLLIIIIALLFFRQKPQYNITFESNGGSLVETVVVDKNGTIPEPKNPTREGYGFIGWYYNNELYDFTKPVTSDMKLEARWGKLEDVSGESIIKQKELTLNLGDTSKLVETVITEIAYDSNVTWESSAPDIVSVDAKGNITALKEGTAIITVTTQNGKYKITISVKGSLNNDATLEEVVNVTGVSLNKTKLNLEVGKSSKLIATVNPSNATNKNVTWKSSNPNIASVDANGNIKALKAGTATITVMTKDGGYTAKVAVTVTEANTPLEPTTPTVVNVTGVSLNKTTLSLTEGESSKLTATVNPSNATNKNVTWQSSAPNIVSVDANGNIKALKPGNATITVITNDGNYKATCQVTIKEKVASYSVIVTPYVEVAGTYQYSVAVTKDNKTFNGWTVIQFNNRAVVKPGGTLSSERYKDISSATITLADGSTVTATVQK